MEKKEPLSEDDELVQTFRSLRCPLKAEVKVNKMTSKIDQPKKK